MYSIENNGQRLQNKEQANNKENYVKTKRIGNNGLLSYIKKIRNNGPKNEEQIKMV